MRLRSAARVEAKGWQREWKETEQDKDLVKKKELVKDRKEECRTPNKNNHQTSGTNEERNEQEAKTPVLKNIQVRGNEKTEHDDEKKTGFDRCRGATNKMGVDRDRTDSFACSRRGNDSNVLSRHDSPNARTRYGTTHSYRNARNQRKENHARQCKIRFTTFHPHQ
mmetsp:Transcript_11553/g.71061  ORF Transcript_11553/g.71061 Transcript_11553/m.71061 type:complete len:166 (+) Transcript_11553:399-896(+)